MIFNRSKKYKERWKLVYLIDSFYLANREFLGRLVD